ncbi:MAG TPA: antitoxin VapB family protein [Candidatus Nanoarchaeia archaeon]|nr:antitoxin VapB family protein [Candidatus Nanoarchaeia archaeon]
MTSVNITISDKAYDFLKKLKLPDQSFSDIILSMKNKRQNVMAYAGILKSADLDSIDKIRDQARKDWSKR